MNSLKASIFDAFAGRLSVGRSVGKCSILLSMLNEKRECNFHFIKIKPNGIHSVHFMFNITQTVADATALSMQPLAACIGTKVQLHAHCTLLNLYIYSMHNCTFYEVHQTEIISFFFVFSSSVCDRQQMQSNVGEMKWTIFCEESVGRSMHVSHSKIKQTMRPMEVWICNE